MTKIKGSGYDAGFDVGVQNFTYTVVIEHLNWDLAFLNLKLSVIIDRWRAFLPPSEGLPFLPLTSSRGPCLASSR